MLVAAVLLVKYEDMDRGMEDADRTERREKTPGDVGLAGDSSPEARLWFEEEKKLERWVYDLRVPGEAGGVQMELPGASDLLPPPGNVDGDTVGGR